MKKLMDMVMNTCKETSIQLANAEELSPADQLKQKFHLIICPACRKFQKQMQALNENVKRIKIKDFDLKKFNQEIVDKYKN